MNAEVRCGFYKHWKGGIYFVHGLALYDGGTVAVGTDRYGDQLVIYQSVQSCEAGMMRARTLADFTALVADRDGHQVPRFVRVEGW